MWGRRIVLGPVMDRMLTRCGKCITFFFLSATSPALQRDEQQWGFMKWPFISRVFRSFFSDWSNMCKGFVLSYLSISLSCRVPCVLFEPMEARSQMLCLSSLFASPLCSSYFARAFLSFFSVRSMTLWFLYSKRTKWRGSRQRIPRRFCSLFVLITSALTHFSAHFLQKLRIA